MDAIYFRDKAETCLRLAKGLSWNNPARGELMELAEEFQRQAKELEASARSVQAPQRWCGSPARMPRFAFMKNFPALSVT
jgi:hypothetical protein